MNQDIEKLINSTTIVKVIDNKRRVIIFGDEYFASRFQRDQGQQIDSSSLEGSWDKKWRSFGDIWAPERQNYRFLYDSFKLFYYSFEQLRFNKLQSIQNYDDKKKILYFNYLCGVNLYGVYHHGKKCIDLLKALDLIQASNQNWDFYLKFSETRNKLIEHNFNPYDSKRQPLNLQIEPHILSLISTNSLLEIAIHKPSQERVFDVYVDYYEDYFDLEKNIGDVIKTF
ncbi:MAG: hypothetical protein NUV61_03535 [Candidatus Azambacteria bacterium]|nr:hypothetical protein [Candidatus Azambacteria bacterium]